MARDLFRKSWDRLQNYLYVFSEQEDAFALLIDGLFPGDNDLDAAARNALSFEAKGMFLALDDIREAGREKLLKVCKSFEIRREKLFLKQSIRVYMKYPTIGRLSFVICVCRMRSRRMRSSFSAMTGS